MLLEINVNINAPAIVEAVGKLASALLAGYGEPAALVPAPAKKHNTTPAKPAGPAASAKKEKAAEQPAMNEPAPAPIPVQNEAMPDQNTAVTAPEKKADEPVKITLDDLSRAGAALVDKGKMPQVIELLNGKYGVQAITQLPPSTYAELAADLRALGAAI